jgi:hypothetical protein
MQTPTRQQVGVSQLGTTVHANSINTGPELWVLFSNVLALVSVHMRSSSNWLSSFACFHPRSLAVMTFGAFFFPTSCMCALCVQAMPWSLLHQLQPHLDLLLPILH